jgi:hypothetical protein
MISHFNVNSYVWHRQVDWARVVGEEMMKRIGGRIGASFHYGMSGLSAHVTVCVQLTCGSGMTLIGPGGVNSSVPIQTQTLWYGGNFFVSFKFYKVPYIR